MSTGGVVAFRNQKLQVLQESINNSANTAKATKKEIIIVRKKQKILDSDQAINQLTLSKSKKPKPKESPMTRIHNPPPIAVARRNARERNRVKQVNNGFATLRQHIPNEIAEIYESANNNRAANKKLSKVETLRMAVEYIRSLENLLSLDVSRDSKDNTSLSSFPSPASSESLQNSSSYEQGYFSIQSPLLDDDDSNPPTALPPVSSHHYSRIPGTNTFQLLPGPPPINYEDEENIHPLTPNSDQDMMISPNVVDYSQQFTVIHPNMLSPNLYSESSSSPHQNVDILDLKYSNLIPGHQILYQTPMMFNQSVIVPSDIPLDRLGEVVRNSQMNDVLTAEQFLGDKLDFGGELKQEPEDQGFQKDIDTDDSMEDVIKWWETEGRHEDQS